MNEYHKIHSLFKRDLEKPKSPIIIGDYAQPEFAYLAHNEWVWSEKVNGMNLRVMYDGGTITFGGKTDNAQLPAPLVAVLQGLFLPQLAVFQELFGEGPVCLCGEGYGGKIQKGGGNYRNGQGFVLFDIQCGHWWLERHNVEDVARKLELDIVPIVGAGTLIELINFVQAGFLSRWGNFYAEGVVARPRIELKTRSGHRIITKLKTQDFVK